MRFIIGLATLAALIASPGVAQHAPATPTTPAQVPPPHWSYDGEAGPAAWGRLDPAYAVCATGQQESPVDLTGAVRADLGPVEIDWLATDGRVIDTGHAVQIEVAPGGATRFGGRHYVLRQFHLHQPSEHLVDGRRFPLEIHFVHAGPDGALGVVAVLVEEGTAHPALAAVLRSEEGLIPIDPSTLLPVSRGFFRYEGSLTTPPCSETVDWLVLDTPITASTEQIAAFGRLHGGNARPVQPLNRRFLLRSGLGSQDTGTLP